MVLCSLVLNDVCHILHGTVRLSSCWLVPGGIGAQRARVVSRCTWEFLMGTVTFVLKHFAQAKLFYLLGNPQIKHCLPLEREPFHYTRCRVFATQ